jgi:signal-transduction protein with cAMP-binding, CBS, and nucleotidyltransferase domain
MMTKLVRVRDIMKVNFDEVDGMATIKEALQTMQHVETKTLIVNKRSKDDEFGILSLPDIARKVLAKNRSPERTNVYEIMTKPALTVDSAMDIKYCARLFDNFHISRAPVVENGQVIGLISLTDMVLRGMCDNIGK